MSASTRSARPGAIRHNLPIELTRLVGRDEALGEIRRLLRGDLSGSRLVTLTGVGGAGKTRLALRAATDVAGDFPDGVWLVELAALGDPALVARALAATLGIREQADQPLGQTLAAVLASKHLLLVLDNCEHLAGACAELVETLLRFGPDLNVLATSREPLRVPGEVTWTVPPLALPPTDTPLALEELARIEAVALFVDRARARRPSFRLTSANAPAVIAICRGLEGLPLALELAAAQLGALQPEQLVGRLGDPLRLLRGGNRTLPRQETLRAALDWSHALLRPVEQAVFRRAAVFRGAFSVDAAEFVCAGPDVGPADVYAVLAGLVDKSVVGVTGGAENARFRLLEPVRQYAEERLHARGETALTRRRHAQAFLALAEAAAPDLRSRARGPWLTRLEAELTNLRAALDWTLGDADGSAEGAEKAEPTDADRALGIRLVAALVHFWFFRGYFSEGVSWVRRAVAQPPELAPAARAKALCVGGELAWMLFGPSALSKAWLAESVALWRALGDAPGLAYALQASATVGPREADADGNVREGLALSRAQNDLPGIALALHAAALLALQRSDWTAAREHLSAALDLYRAVGDDWYAAQVLNSLGDVARIQGEDVQAAALYGESLALFRSQGVDAAIPSVVQNLGHLALRAGDARRARALFRESLGMFRDQADRRGAAEALAGLAGALAALKHPARAALLFGAAEALLRASGADMWPANRPDYERAVALARDQLSAPDFAAAWTSGRVQDPERAIVEALSDDPLPSGDDQVASESSPPARRALLTPREREVARLVARGLTNGQIAAELVITPGTAGLHVKNILGKLGFSTRAQIAAWAVARGLVTPPPA